MRNATARTLSTTTEALSALVAFVLLLVAVGGLGERVAGSNDLADKARNAQERAGSYRFVMTEKFGGAATARVPSISMQGSFNARAGIGRFVTEFHVLGFSARCTYLFTKSGFLYVNVHPSRRKLLGAAWLRTDAKANATALGFRPDELYSRGKEFLADVKADGSAVVRGVQTTRYRGRQDLTSFLPNASSRPAQAELAKIRTVPFEVFIDSGDLIRRMVIHLERQGFGLTLSMDFFDYGKPVYLSEPPAAQTKPGGPAQTALACYPATFGRAVKPARR
jgi:hypothetical protein